MNKILVQRAIAAALLSSLLVACGAELKPVMSDEELVAQRAQARVDAMVGADYATAYRYYTPGYRSSINEADFIVRYRVSQVRWTGARVVETTCEESLCTVLVDIDYLINEPLRGVSEHRSTRRVDENWINIADQWYYVDES